MVQKWYRNGTICATSYAFRFHILCILSLFHFYLFVLPGGLPSSYYSEEQAKRERQKASMSGRDFRLGFYHSDRQKFIKEVQYEFIQKPPAPLEKRQERDLLWAYFLLDYCCLFVFIAYTYGLGSQEGKAARRNGRITSFTFSWAFSRVVWFRLGFSGKHYHHSVCLNRFVFRR